MGLPRYLIKKEKELLENHIAGIKYFAEKFFMDESIIIEKFLKENLSLKKYNKYKHDDHTLSHFTRKSIKEKYNLDKSVYKFEKIEVKLIKNVYCEKSNGKISVFVEFTKKCILEGISTSDKLFYLGDDLYFYSKKHLEKFDKYRRITDFINRLCKKNKTLHKEYESRNFPSTLRNVIFTRDNFTCKICNTHKDNLPDKIHLEVDHILSWQDGGKTTYSNGQTICSDCNKGKHHAKKYLKLAV